MTYYRKLMNTLCRRMSRRHLFGFCVIAGMAVGMFAHGFMFANKIPNHDDLHWYADITGAGLESGRYVLYFFWKLFSTLSTPWFNGMLGLLFLSLATFFLADTFEARKPWQALGLVCILITYPTNASVYGFMYEAHAFMLGVMFAAFTPWAVRYLRGGWFLAGVSAFLATGIYQVYIMLTIGLMLLLVIRETALGALAPGEAQRTGRQAWGFAVGCAGVAIAGLALYMAGSWVLTKTGLVTLSGYQGINQMGTLDWAALPEKILLAYRTVRDELITDLPNYTTRLMQITQLGILAVGAAALAAAVIGCFWKKHPAHGALIIVCTALLPLTAAGIYFMGNEIVVHQMTMYPLVVLLVAPVLLLSTLEPLLPALPRARRAGVAAVLALCLSYGFCFASLSNQAYYRMHMAFTRAEHLAARMAAVIEQTPGYHSGARVVTVGHVRDEEPLMFMEFDIAARFLPFVGVRNEPDYFWPDNALYMLTRIVGLPMEPVLNWNPTPEEQAIVDAMPLYPAEGSIVFIDDLCVIRLS